MIFNPHVNNNVLSSVESRLEPMGFGDAFCCQMCWCCYATFSFLIQNECSNHNVNAQNVKIARRDRPYIIASHRCETALKAFTYSYCSSEENSFRDFTLKNLNGDFLPV